MSGLIYLDSAATSMQKPQSVGQAMLRTMRTASSTGRGAHPAAMAASETVLNCRMEIAELFNVSEPDNVVFTLNATHALNIAINATVKSGARVLISGYEHNSVTRPLYARGAEMLVARSPLFDQEAAFEEFKSKISRAEVVVCTHVSNVFGFVLPVERIAELCRENNVPLIIDASQSAGVLPLDFAALGAKYIAMPGHKSLLGPQGTGVLLCEQPGEPLMFGGSGSYSYSPEMPEFLPDRYEAGTLNVSGIAGLLEGVRYVKRKGESAILRHEKAMISLLSDALSKYPAVRQYRSRDMSCQTGVLSIVVENRDCSEAAEFLANKSIAVRSGLHCSPEAHKTVGTNQSGTVRFSVSPFTTRREVLTAAAALGEFAK